MKARLARACLLLAAAAVVAYNMTPWPVIARVALAAVVVLLAAAFVIPAALKRTPDIEVAEEVPAPRVVDRTPRSDNVGKDVTS